MLFRKKKNIEKELNGQSEMKDKVAKNIAAFLLSVQKRFSIFMNERSDRLSRQGKQVGLTLFCLVFGGLSIQALMGAFSDKPNSSQQLKPVQLSVPRYYDGSGTKSNKQIVSEREITRINRFKRYMDSLSLSGNGKEVYDNIILARPGLMDSIHAIEQLYYSQTK